MFISLIFLAHEKVLLVHCISFIDADVENADFTEAALGNFDLKNLCKNPTLRGENPVTGVDTRFSVGCGP